MSRKIKVVFNATTSVVGGAIQTATNFVYECLLDKDTFIDWRFFLSMPVAHNLISLGVSVNDDPRFHVIKVSPARSKPARQKIINLIKEEQPTLVYTMSGPAYVNFPVFHVQGCSAPYVTHARTENYFSQGVLKGCYKLLESIAKLCYFHNAEHLVFQTDSSRRGFLRRSFWSEAKTSVIPNAIGHTFTCSIPRTCPKSTSHSHANNVSSRFFRILIPSAYYSHKNLSVVVPTAKILKEFMGDRFTFVMTLPFGDEWQKIEIFAAKEGVNEHVVNHGPFTVSEAPALYRDSDILFLPTRLETFSASYLEAMWCNLPIVTSDLDFARDLCGDTAVYADTLDPKTCAETIQRVIEDPKLVENLTKACLEKVGEIPTSHTRYHMIINLLHDLSRQAERNYRL